jgi:hypothetical protein
MGHSQPKDSMPDSTGEYFFFCKNLRLEVDSCLPQALNIAFGEVIFSTKQSFVNTLGSNYKESKSAKDKMEVLTYSAQKLRVGGINWNWDLISSTFLIENFKNNYHCASIIACKMSAWMVDEKHLKFKKNEW